MSRTVLETVPNVSEGRDEQSVDDIARAFAAHGCTLLDVHSDADHNRSVFTLVGEPQELADALVAGARAAIARIDMRTHEGAHPCIGALDVVPIVYLRERGPRAGRRTRRSRSRTGSPASSTCRCSCTGSSPRAGAAGARVLPRGRRRGARRAHARRASWSRTSARRACTRPAGATLVPRARRWSPSTSSWTRERPRAARRRSPREVREAGGGLPGVRAIGVQLERAGVGAGLDERARPVPGAAAGGRRGRAARGATAGSARHACARAGRAGARGGARRLPGGRALRGFDERGTCWRNACARRRSTMAAMASSGAGASTRTQAGTVRARGAPRRARAPRRAAPPSSAASDRLNRRRPGGAPSRAGRSPRRRCSCSLVAAPRSARRRARSALALLRGAALHPGLPLDGLVRSTAGGSAKRAGAD